MPTQKDYKMYANKLYLKLWLIGLLVVCLISWLGGLFLVRTGTVEYLRYGNIHMLEFLKQYGYNCIEWSNEYHFIAVYWQGQIIFQLGIMPFMG